MTPPIHDHSPQPLFEDAQQLSVNELQENSFFYSPVGSREEVAINKIVVDDITWPELLSLLWESSGSFPDAMSQLVHAAISASEMPKLLSLQRGDTLDPGIIDANFPGHTLVVLRGGLTAFHKDASYEFGPGSICRDPSLLPEDSRWLTGRDRLSIALLPHAVLQPIESQNLEVRRLLSINTIEKVMNPRFTPETRGQIRKVRDANVLMIARLTAIEVVNNPEDGILNILNPSRQEFSDERYVKYLSDGTQTLTGQAWRLIEQVAPALYYLNISDINRIAQKAYAEANEQAEHERVRSAFTRFEQALETLDPRAEHQQMLSALAQDFAFSTSTNAEEWKEVAQRIQQIRWLALLLEKREEAVADFRQGIDLATIRPYQDFSLSSATLSHYECKPERVLHLLDSTLEFLFSFGASHPDGSLYPIRFKRLDKESAAQFAAPPGRVLEKSHPDYEVLRRVSRQLAEGSTSAVGGRIYGESRIPAEVLDELREGRARAFVYDGPPQDEEVMVRHLFGRRVDGAGVDMLRGVKTNLHAVYGGFVRSWYSFENGDSVVTMLHPGRDRRLSNALALVLSDVPVENIDLAESLVEDRERIRADLKALLDQSESRVAGGEVLGVHLQSSVNLPTHLLILQRQREFWHQFESSKCVVHDLSAPNIGRVAIAFMRDAEGELLRLVIPTVGSRGLYGNTERLFTESFFDLVNNPSPHVHHSGTAGGFQEKFGKSREDSAQVECFCFPSGYVGAGDEVVAIQTLLTGTNQTKVAESPAEKVARDLLKVRMRNAEVEMTERHYSVRAPGEETTKLIEWVRNQGFSSIDVEAMPLWRALQRVAEKKDLAPTVNYWLVISDNPQDGLRDITKTLAMNGPLLEGSNPIPELYACIASGLDLAHARHWGRRVFS